MSASVSVEPRFDLSGGALCLDFANTLDDRDEPHPDERLESYDDLIAFSLESGTISAGEGKALATIADMDGERADQALGHARALREAIYSIFSAVAVEQEPADEALVVLNRWIVLAHQHGGVGAVGDRFQWVWESGDTESGINLDRPLWPVARSAMELLLDGDLSRLRECAADNCGWLFLDTTRNRSRRWCSMQTCGNRVKVQGFRERQRKGKNE